MEKLLINLPINCLLLMQAIPQRYSIHKLELLTIRPPDAFANQRHFCFSYPISDTYSEIQDFDFPLLGMGLSAIYYYHHY